MLRRAQWRNLPDDPVTGLGWLLRERHRWLTVSMRRALLAVSLLASYALLAHAWATFFFSALAWFALLHVAFPADAQGPEFANPSPCVGFTGGIEIWHGEMRLGEDRVAVTLSDGWLLVEGNRTSFALRTSDALGFSRSGSVDVLRLADGSEVHFAVRVKKSREDFLHDDGYRSKMAWITFESCLREWYGGEVARGESVMPPDRVHRSATARFTSDAFLALVAVLVLPVTYGFCGWGGSLAALLFLPGPWYPDPRRSVRLLYRHLSGR